jgi:hypothetical protein
MKPWYIAYVVNTSRAKINLLSPKDQDMPVNSGILFNWETEEEELSDFTVYVAVAASFNASEIIYKKASLTGKSLDPVTFRPEPGKTYYWIVLGKTRAGELVWSPKGMFSMKGEGNATAGTTSLKAVVYPNPGYPGEIRLACSSENAGPASCRVYSAGGSLVFREDIMLAGSGQVTAITLPSCIKQGIYVAEITGNGERVIRKMVVL